MRKSSLFFFFLVFSFVLFGQDLQPLTDSGDFISRLKEKSKSTQSISADFKEEKYLSFLKEPQKSSGVFYYQAENKMRWEQKIPSEYIILINDDEIRLQENGKEKNVNGAKRITSKVKDLMLTLIKGDFHENKAFDAKYFQNEAYFVIVLDPQNKKLSNVFDKIELRFSKKELNLDRLTFFEKEGDKSVMTFYNQKINEEIEAHFFKML
jgi:outer membrane lipoprotein-sorting protein